MKNSDYILYLDMDGVLCDYDSGYYRIAREVEKAGVEKEKRVEAIRKAYHELGAQFWAELEWIRGGQELWETSKRLFERVCILSSTGAKADPEGRGKIVEAGKREWLKKNMPDMPEDRIFIVHGKHLKQNHASKISILVDDMRSTIEQWNAAGGFGILHDDRRYKNTIETLIEIAVPMSLSEMAKLVRH